MNGLKDFVKILASNKIFQLARTLEELARTLLIKKIFQNIFWLM